MTPVTATTLKALHRGAGPTAPYTSAEPQYTHVGEGRFMPANAAAWHEVERWNAWADQVNARAPRSNAS